jgi:hypothetical protein
MVTTSIPPPTSLSAFAVALAARCSSLAAAFCALSASISSFVLRGLAVAALAAACASEA